MTYCDSHVEFIHHPEDLAMLPNAEILLKQISIESINLVKPDLLFLAAYVEATENAWRNLTWVLDQYIKIANTQGWVLVKSAKDLNREGIKIILHVENLYAIGNDITKIDQLYDIGVRSIGLTHNPANQFAGGNMSNQSLTGLGILAINKILEKRMILDMAHLNTVSSLQVIKRYQLDPFISHTGIAGVFSNLRNINDLVLEKCSVKDSYIGLGLAGTFLNNNKASREDWFKQLDYAILKTGIKHIGIGSDFGGITSFLPAGLENIKLLNITIHESEFIDQYPGVSGGNLINWLSRHFS